MGEASSSASWDAALPLMSQRAFPLAVGGGFYYGGRAGVCTMSVSLLHTTLPLLLSVLNCSEELEIVNCVSLVSAAFPVVHLEIS